MKISRKPTTRCSSIVTFPSSRRTFAIRSTPSPRPNPCRATFWRRFSKAHPLEILKSYQGVHGGYQMAKLPSQVSVLDVIEAMDGPLGINLCVRGEDGCDCEKSGRCTMFPFWDKLQKQLKTILKAETMVKLRGSKK